MSDRPPILVTTKDLARLQGLVDSSSGPQADALDEELARAQVVAPEKIPADVVTMNSVVRFRDEQSGEAQDVTLCYPPEADASQGRVSVLAPVGCALLGLQVGQNIDWPLPGGRTRRLRLMAVLYQPEAAGDSRL